MNLCLFKNYSKIWLILSIFLFTCAPLPKEGESFDKAEVTLTLQHRSSERSERVGSSSRSTEFIVVVAGDIPFSMAGPADYLNFGLLDLNSNQITLSLDLDTSLQLFVYRYAETFSLSSITSKTG